MAKRYSQLIDLAAEIAPRHVVEVGVHGAIRAVKICARALRASKNVSYTGYDVFDTMDEQFQMAALNGKGTATEALARSRLDDLKSKGRFDYRLVVGDTRKTLHGKQVAADLAFIDGDHRVEVIAGDYEALQGSKVVVFDDFYRAGPQGKTPDIQRFGANQLIDELIDQGRDVQILPVGDQTKDGWLSHLVVVR